ncbi:MAG: GntR family transcriptional regulator [Variovorax sp.]|nr:GntR family transcriptional regulator [Variovorax sp.]
MGTKPQYRKIADSLAKEIQSGRYPVGSTLPTEKELCESFGVSRHTAREALRRIEDMGLITRRQGSGTTVVASTPPVRYEQSIESIGDLMHQSSASRLQVVECIEVPDDFNEFASQISLITKMRCIRVRSIRYPRNDVRPLAVQDLYAAVYTAAQARKLLNPDTAAREIVAMCDTSRLDRIEQVFSAVNLAAPDAKLLHVKTGLAAFQTVRHYYDLGSRLVAVSHALYQGELFKYASTLRGSAAQRGIKAAA